MKNLKGLFLCCLIITSLSCRGEARQHKELLGLEFLPVEILEQRVEIPPDQENRFYLAFHGDKRRYSAVLGCNTINGSYSLSDHGGFESTPPISTLMSCPDMSLEQLFIQALEDIQFYSFDGEVLHFYGEDSHAPLAVFALKS